MALYSASWLSKLFFQALYLSKGCDEGVIICHMGDQGGHCSFVSAVRLDLRQNRTGVTRIRTSRILSTIQERLRYRTSPSLSQFLLKRPMLTTE